MPAYSQHESWLGMQSHNGIHHGVTEVRLSPAPASPTSASSGSVHDWAGIRAPRPGIIHPPLGLPNFGVGNANMRVEIPLRSLGDSQTEKAVDSAPKKAKLLDVVEEEALEDETPTKISPSSSRLYPFLTSGDPGVKLPALRSSLTPPSRESTVSPPSSPGSSSAGKFSPPATKTSLPSLASLSLADGYGSTPVSSRTTIQPLKTRRTEITYEERVRHATLIRTLLIAINKQWATSQREISPPSDLDSEDEDSCDEQSVDDDYRMQSEVPDIDMMVSTAA